MLTEAIEELLAGKISNGNHTYLPYHESGQGWGRTRVPQPAAKGATVARCATEDHNNLPNHDSGMRREGTQVPQPAACGRSRGQECHR